MEVPQGNVLCSNIKQAKMSFTSIFFSYTKLEERGTGSALGVLVLVGLVGRCGSG
jgi:hypothetical protein